MLLKFSIFAGIDSHCITDGMTQQLNISRIASAEAFSNHNNCLECAYKITSESCNGTHCINSHSGGRGQPIAQVIFGEYYSMQSILSSNFFAHAQTVDTGPFILCFV